ncbi:thioredoxin family protein [Gaetbulibacter saemankumensis]|uniref:thioredoxin family protein n=1 Tax=Gaetbulibacter saemankumensis TaxID=311208 RepID=UPI000409A688|nr:thioredoxin family protein [Gaetbulibacter saemankumensis]
MNSIIKNSLENSMSYADYRDLVRQLVEDKSTTGADKSESFVDLTKLNNNRMKRWDKTLKISDEHKFKIIDFNHSVTWLMIAESWCGDAAHVLPVINKIAELNDDIDLKIVLRDDNPELMDQFLTNGARSIPKMIMIDNETGDVIETYGPRPTEATNFVTRYKNKYGKLTAEFKEDLQHWYNQNKGQNIVEDITKLLCRLEPSVCL